MFENEFELARKIIAFCTKKGMESSEVFISYRNQKEITMNGTSISNQRIKEEMGAGVRIIHKGAVGFAYTNILTQKSLEKTALNAFTFSKLSPKIDGIQLPTKHSLKKIDKTFNPEIANLSVEELINDANNFIKGMTSIDKRLQTSLSSITTTVEGKAIINSNAVEGKFNSTSYQAGLVAIANDNGKAGAFTFENVFNRAHDSDLHSIGMKIGKQAIDNLNQEQIKAFDGPVIMQPLAVLNPVAIVLSLNSSADWRQRGVSLFKDKLADKVANDSLNFSDKPYNLEGGTGVTPFDDEGNPCTENIIIKDGIFETFLHNQRTANKENLPSTGNAIRTIGSDPPFIYQPLIIVPQSPWIHAGDISEEEMVANISKGLIVHDITGTVRFESGVFSGVAKGAYLIEKGEITKPVTGISLSGNIKDIINKISGIGKKYHLAGGWLTTPLICFDGIKITTQ